MKKSVLLIVGIMASMLVACQGKTDVKETSTIATESTKMETLTEAETIEAETMVEASVDNSLDKYSSVDFGKYKVAEEVEVGKLKQFAEVAEVEANGKYLVYTRNGPFFITVKDDTEVTGEVEVGSYITFTDNGIAATSYPGQIGTVFTVEVVTESDVVVESNTTDKTLTENSETNLSLSTNDVTFIGEVKSIEVRDNTVDYYVITEVGDKIFHIQEDLIQGKDIVEGSTVEIVTDGVETRSLPGQLSGITSIEIYSEQ